MDERLSALESAVDELRSTARSLQERVELLEVAATSRGEIAPERDTAADLEAASVDRQASRAWRDPIAILSLLGRLLIVLGGGYMLRAMTDSRVVPPGVGVALGLAYGLVWLVMADRAGAGANVPSAAFHGVGAAAVAFPIVLEATTRFGVLTGPAGALVVAVMTAGFLAVAWRRRIQSLAWIAAAGAIPTSIVVLARTGIVVPHAYFLIAFGIATLWMGYSLDWFLLRWPVAAAADLVVVGVTLRAVTAQPRETPGQALAVQVVLLGAYLASVAVRTLVRGRDVVPFEVVQTIAALAVGLGGALSVTHATGSGAALLGVASVVLGAASYGVALAFVEQQQKRRRNVYFYTSLALILVLVGTTTLLEGLGEAGALAVLAVVCSVAWARSGRWFLLLHAATYIVAAALACGAVWYDVRALAAGAATPWPPPSVAMLLVLGASAVSAWLAARNHDGDGSAHTRAPRLIIVLVLLMSAGGAVIGWLAPVLGGRPDGSIDLGVLATIRTGVLALAALAVAWIGRHARFREWGWVVYPLLVGIGLKVVAQDFAHSRPATLFVALALYGAALILAPRMRRRQA